MHKDRIDELTSPDKKAEYDETQRINDGWAFLLKSRHGRVVLRDLLQITYFGVSALGENEMQTVANASVQRVGQYAMEKVQELYPEAYGLMMKEAREDFENDRRTNDTRTSSPERSSTGGQ